MQNVCRKMVPIILTIEQKEACENIYTNTLNAIENDSNFLERVITCDESCFFTYYPEIKRQSMHWKSLTSPRAKKARISKSKFKAKTIIVIIITPRKPHTDLKNTEPQTDI